MTLKIVQIKPELKGLRDVDHLGLSQSEDQYLSQNGYGLAEIEQCSCEYRQHHRLSIMLMPIGHFVIVACFPIDRLGKSCSS